MSVTILDATPENSNDEECTVCKAEPSMPCVYSTNPPIARDRMHYGRLEAAAKAQTARKALRPAHEISLTQRNDTRTTRIVSVLTVTDSNTGDVLHRYDLSERDVVRLLSGAPVNVNDEKTEAL